LATFSLAREQHRAALARLDRDLEDQASRLALLDEEWQKAWARVPVTLRSPAEMLGFRRRYDDLVSVNEQRASARRHAERLLREQQNVVDRLSSALSAAGVPLDVGLAHAELA